MIHAEPTVTLYSTPPKHSGGARALRALFLIALFVLIAGFVVYRGIHTRIQTAPAVKDQTLALAVRTVAVIQASPGALQDEVVLPGNIQAFINSPIYAIT